MMAVNDDFGLDKALVQESRPSILPTDGVCTNMARTLWVFERPFYSVLGLRGPRGVWGDPHSDGEERAHGLWRILRSKAGVAPDSPATRQNGLSTVGRQSERTGSPVTYDSTTMECEIEAAIEWRVQERALSSPAINGVSSSESKLD